MKCISAFVVLLVATTISGRCLPSDTETSLKCYCTPNDVLGCHNITTNQHMQLIIESFKGIPLKTVRFEFTDLETLPSELFNKLKFSRLELFDSTFKRLTRDDDQSFPTDQLNSLRITHSDIRSGYLDDIGIFRNLTTLELGGYRRPIDAFSFSKMLSKTNLRELSIFETEFKWTVNALSPLSNLQVLTLSYATIKRIARSDLPANSTNLGYIYLRDCGITSLPDDLFDGLPKLQVISLYSNKLSSLSEKTFKNFNGTLNVKDNPLDCGPGLQWLVDRVKNGSLKLSDPDSTYCKDGSKVIK